MGDFISGDDLFVLPAGTDLGGNVLDGLGPIMPESSDIITGLVDFPNHSDLVVLHSMVKEYTQRFHQEVTYRKQLTNLGDLDPVHMEITDEEKVWSDDMTFHCFIEYNPPEKNLSRWGIDESRDIILHVPAVILALIMCRQNSVDLYYLATRNSTTGEYTWQVDIGDRFTFDGHEYEVLNLLRSQYWYNSNIASFLHLASNRVHPHSLMQA